MFNQKNNNNGSLYLLWTHIKQVVYIIKAPMTLLSS